ncbi:LysE family translocator [Pseudomonas petrae]|uniref:LysE family translocator n=1 Tax=Pseudomonas petrae TaxID=2912190 RepID=A0ABS9I6H1_9PSED|nr:LysE family translocator [Pseudomonas petrae]MCF7532286.1 LysE family translocator [Pseudomonas petrae]MCF7535918.1 LysE family translocator [Pseudomonas petrae]MCF7542779.1 LysE family translocator [Pseudomonas petrae]MCF7554982.1 LysE family translocator [Pseudomonas petrae]
MNISLMAAFWAVSLMLVLTPGADWAYAISAGMRGRRVVVPAVAGMMSAHLAATLVVAAGVGGLVTRTPGALSFLTVAGAAYLAWMGIGMLRHPSAPTEVEVEKSASQYRWALRGACMAGLNPKLFLFFLALLPQFTSLSAEWPVPVQIICLGLLHIAGCSLVYLAVGFGAEVVLSSRPIAARRVSQLSGFVMILLAVALTAERLVV